MNPSNKQVGEIAPDINYVNPSASSSAVEVGRVTFTTCESCHTKKLKFRFTGPKVGEPNLMPASDYSQGVSVPTQEREMGCPKQQFQDGDNFEEQPQPLTVDTLHDVLCDVLSEQTRVFQEMIETLNENINCKLNAIQNSLDRNHN